MTKKLTDLTEVTTTEDSDLLLIRDATDGVDKKMQAQNLRAKATTKDDVGLANVPDLDTTDAVNKAHDQNTDTVLDQGGANEVTAADARAHIDATDNPHGVTKTQVGLGDVDNVSAADLRDRSTHTGTQTLSTISDAGTIASQDADSVNIDGGTIDGTAVNATTLTNNSGSSNIANLSGSLVGLSDIIFKNNLAANNGRGVSLKLQGANDILQIRASYRGDTDNTDASFVGRDNASEFSFLSYDGGFGNNTTLAHNNVVRINTNGSERMRIDSSGNVGIGTTSNPDNSRLHVLADGTHAPVTIQVPKTISYTHIFFRNPNGVVGSIQTGGTSTSYLTSSDYRLKENIQPLTGALDKVQAMNPVTYDWKAGGEGKGFIAHELQEIAPYAVSGEKDGEDMQGVDYGKLTTLLAGAVKELTAKVEQLEAQLNAN